MLVESVTVLAGLATIVSTYYTIRYPNHHQKTGRRGRPYSEKNLFSKGFEKFFVDNVSVTVGCFSFLCLMMPQVFIPLSIIMIAIIFSFRKSAAKGYYCVFVVAFVLSGVIGAYLSQFEVFPISMLPFMYSDDFRIIDIRYYLP